jgi:uncharacterized protein YpuA (DUF1002 family)
MDQFVQFLEHLGPIPPAVTGLAALIGLAIRFYLAGHRKEIQVLKAHISQQQQQLKQLNGQDPKALQQLVNQVREQLEHARGQRTAEIRA